MATVARSKEVAIIAPDLRVRRFGWGDEGDIIEVECDGDLCGEHLAPFKVPRKVVFVDEIPVGPTGKRQRLGLAERLGLG